MHHQTTGHCRCGAVQLRLTLPEPISHFTPRACDCDWCQARKVCYLSHPAGTLAVTSKQPLQQEQQGSGQATFHSCPQCGDLVAVSCEIAGELRGAVNASRLDARDQLPAAETVSPRLLSPVEKKARWDSAWLRLQIKTSGD